jgi:hypothetical protein
MPEPHALVLGGEIAPSPWSEFRYWAYTYVVPTTSP